MLLSLRFSGSGSSLVKLDLTSDDHMIRYAANFWLENMKNYNLLLANWKILNIFITFQVFGVEKSIEDVNFAVQQPRDRMYRHFWRENMNFLKIAAYPAKWSSDIKCDVSNRLPDPENLYSNKFILFQ